MLAVPLPRDVIALDEECCLHRVLRAPRTVIHRVPSIRTAAWIVLQELSAKSKIGILFIAKPTIPDRIRKERHISAKHVAVCVHQVPGLVPRRPLAKAL